MSFELTPCDDWTTAAQVKECDAYADVDDIDLVTPIAIASDLLFRLSGMQFSGECTSTVRPVTHPDHKCGCGVCSVESSYGHAYEFDARVWPVTSITQILIDGNALTLNAAHVVVHDGRWLVRTDGLPWPSSQVMRYPSSSQGTWQVTFTHGQAPPPSGVLAASTLAGELALACGNEDACKRCRLSKRVQQVTRQGMSMMLIDPFQFLDKRRLGIMEIDAFLATYNPEGLMGEPMLASPELRPTFVRQTWP